MAKHKTMTWEEKQAAREAAELVERTKQGAQYKARVAKERAQVVVTSASELGKRMFAEAEDNRAITAAYDMLYKFECAQKEYARALEYLVDSATRAQRELTERSNYSSSPIQSRGLDADVAHAKYTTMREAAYYALRVLDVHCPALFSVREQDQRMARLSYAVVPVLGAAQTYFSILHTVGDGAEMLLDEHLQTRTHETEEAAWLAVAALVGDDVRY